MTACTRLTFLDLSFNPLKLSFNPLKLAFSDGAGRDDSELFTSEHQLMALGLRQSRNKMWPPWDGAAITRIQINCKKDDGSTPDVTIRDPPGGNCYLDDDTRVMRQLVN